jgi:hypothetical protein
MKVPNGSSEFGIVIDILKSVYLNKLRKLCIGIVESN